jgi:hypothetical protein
MTSLEWPSWLLGASKGRNAPRPFSFAGGPALLGCSRRLSLCGRGNMAKSYCPAQPPLVALTGGMKGSLAPIPSTRAGSCLLCNSGESDMGKPSHFRGLMAWPRPAIDGSGFSLTGLDVLLQAPSSAPGCSQGRRADPMPCCSVQQPPARAHHSSELHELHREG